MMLSFLVRRFVHVKLALVKELEKAYDLLLYLSLLL